ncbi:outer membrane lipoprotein-sorting protein [Candidatus Saganbacteria bacterium]|nr:outer membrane lipoprotein-sorting protein [Candidatus Saganbacteria bacterium]
MGKKLSVLLGFVLLFAFSTGAFAISANDVLSKAKANYEKIKTFSATISVKMLGEKSKKSSQLAKMMFKGKDKMRIESDKDKVTIVNGNRIKLTAHGQTKVDKIDDLRKKSGREDIGKNPLDVLAGLEKNNLSIKEQSDSYVITAIPKKENPLVSKVEVVVKKDAYLPTKLVVIGTDGKVISGTQLTYSKVAGIDVVSKMGMEVNLFGKKIATEMSFKDIKVNEDISDDLFKM